MFIIIQSYRFIAFHTHNSSASTTLCLKGEDGASYFDFKRAEVKDLPSTWGHLLLRLQLQLRQPKENHPRSKVAEKLACLIKVTLWVSSVFA
ncbi:Uncharacterized protein TCM_022175 [Theobroma cacao]|uniref:Uncharacterized protein n=1 Tax=Theobroma cacao TaxID=3641 RepID=A0A061ET72_THECC|nr:Uncharacterized protein TCM_022175 [Theobroma cacao]